MSLIKQILKNMVFGTGVRTTKFSKKVRYGTVWYEFFENSRESLYLKLLRVVKLE